MSLVNEVGFAAVRTAPPAAVIWASIIGWGPQQWMYAATTIYVMAQTGYLFWKWLREWRSPKSTES